MGVITPIDSIADSWMVYHGNWMISGTTLGNLHLDICTIQTLTNIVSCLLYNIQVDINNIHIYDPYRYLHNILFDMILFNLDLHGLYAGSAYHSFLYFMMNSYMVESYRYLIRRTNHFSAPGLPCAAPLR